MLHFLLSRSTASFYLLNAFQQPSVGKSAPTPILSFTQSHMWLGNRSRRSLCNGEEFAHWHEGSLESHGFQEKSERSPEVDTLCWTLPVSKLGGMARGSRGLQNDKRACPVPRVGEPLRDLKQQKGEPPGSGLWWYNTLVPCFAGRLISVPYNCLTEGGVVGSRANRDKCTIHASGPWMGNSFNWADKEIWADQIRGG